MNGFCFSPMWRVCTLVSLLGLLLPTHYAQKCLLPKLLHAFVMPCIAKKTCTDMETHLDFRAYKRGVEFENYNSGTRKCRGKASVSDIFWTSIFPDTSIKCSKIGHLNPTDTDWILKIPDIWASTYI